MSNIICCAWYRLYISAIGLPALKIYKSSTKNRYPVKLREGNPISDSYFYNILTMENKCQCDLTSWHNVRLKTPWIVFVDISRKMFVAWLTLRAVTTAENWATPLFGQYIRIFGMSVLDYTQ